MNGKQATRLRAIARAITPIGSGHVTHSGFSEITERSKKIGKAGIPFTNTECTGYRRTCQELKKEFLAVPTQEREAWLIEYETALGII